MHMMENTYFQEETYKVKQAIEEDKKWGNT